MCDVLQREFKVEVSSGSVQLRILEKSSSVRFSSGLPIMSPISSAKHPDCLLSGSSLNMWKNVGYKGDGRLWIFEAISEYS